MPFWIRQLESFAQARLLVLTDAMGRRTHGLAIAALHLANIAKGLAGTGRMGESPWGRYPVIHPNRIESC